MASDREAAIRWLERCQNVSGTASAPREKVRDYAALLLAKLAAARAARDLLVEKADELMAERDAARERERLLREAVIDYMGPRPADYFLANVPKARRVWDALDAAGEQA